MFENSPSRIRLDLTYRLLLTLCTFVLKIRNTVDVMNGENENKNTKKITKKCFINNIVIKLANHHHEIL